MPHKSGIGKQKNKPFKGSSKHKAENKNFGVFIYFIPLLLFFFKSSVVLPKKSPKWINP